MSKIKLTVVGLDAEEAAAIVGLLPKSCKFTMSNENGARKKERVPRKHGVTDHILKHLVQSKGVMERERMIALAENYGAKNPSGTPFGMIRSGYIKETREGTLRITTKGRDKVKEAK